MTDMADPRCTRVDNGRKIAFAPAVDGKAAVTEAGGVLSLAYRPERRAKLDLVGSEVTVEGLGYTVLSVKENHALGLVRLALSPIRPEAEV